MASNTYVALSTQTLGSAVSSVTFSSIPQGYTDLVIVINANLASTASTYMNFNGDTSGNYSLTRVYGNGSSAVSDRIGTNLTGIDVSYTGSGVGNNVIINVMNYSNTTTNKTSLNRWNTAGSTGYTGANVSLWRSTAAITSIVFSNSVNFAVGSTFTLYGIAASSVGAKATGGSIYQDASYFYHVFSGNGTFTPSQSLTADILVVAGGGAGGAAYSAGGGGAGGVLQFNSQSLTATGYTCTVGAGGAAWSGGYEQNNTNSGNDSQFGALTLVKGGGAGGVVTTYVTGKNGGSGGGAGGEVGSSGGTGTSGQGNNGGGGANNGVGGFAGGGGGWGAAGQSGTTNNGGNGGAGNYSALTDAIGAVSGIGVLSGGHYYIAGGGGGPSQTAGTYQGVGGLGGGANAVRGSSNGTVGLNAVANTGSGGGGVGGALSSGVGGAGGSGVVIVRYAK